MITKTKQKLSKTRLLNTKRNFMQFLSLCTIVILSASIIVLKNQIVTSKNFKKIPLAHAQTTDITSTGAILEEPTAEELKQNQLFSSLYNNLPIVGNNFIIDFDFSNDSFRVLLLDPFDASRANFDAWKSANYADLYLSNFSVVSFTQETNRPSMLSVYPPYAHIEDQITFTTILFNQSGGDNISEVFFGISDCDTPQAFANASEFERHLGYFFGFSYNPQTGTGAVAGENPSRGCSISQGDNPWVEYDDASNVNLQNAIGTLTLNSVSHSVNGRILRVDWSVSFDPVLKTFDDFGFYNYYFIAKNDSNLYNSRDGQETWTFADRPHIYERGVAPSDTSGGTGTGSGSGTGTDAEFQGNCAEGEIDSAIGCVPVRNVDETTKTIITWGIGTIVGIAFILMIYAGYMMQTATDDPRRMQAGKELLTAAVTGVLLAVLSVFILRVIGVDILGLML